MDIFYYSNYCKHSKKIVEYISKNGFIDKLNCICIDKRSRDTQSGQIFIQLENGKKIMMPPNVHSVPALLMTKKNYNAIFGEDILKYLEPAVAEKTPNAIQQNGEPIGITLGQSSAGVNIVSEQYTFYNLSPDELSAKGRGGRRQMYNYVSAEHENPHNIPTPPDTYKPDKLGESVSIDSLQQKRNAELPQTPQANVYGF